MCVCWFPLETNLAGKCKRLGHAACLRQLRGGVCDSFCNRRRQFESLHLWHVPHKCTTWHKTQVQQHARATKQECTHTHTGINTHTTSNAPDIRYSIHTHTSVYGGVAHYKLLATCIHLLAPQCGKFASVIAILLSFILDVFHCHDCQLLPVLTFSFIYLSVCHTDFMAAASHYCRHS